MNDELKKAKEELKKNPDLSWKDFENKFPSLKYSQYYNNGKGKNKRDLEKKGVKVPDGRFKNGKYKGNGTHPLSNILVQVKEEILKNPDITWPELSAKLPNASYIQYYRIFNKAGRRAPYHPGHGTNVRKKCCVTVLDEMKEEFKKNLNISWDEIHAKIPNSKKHQYFYLRQINGTTGIPSKEKLNAVMHRLFSIPSHNLTSVQISDYKDIIVKTATALDQKVQVVELKDPKELWVCRFTK